MQVIFSKIEFEISPFLTLKENGNIFFLSAYLWQALKLL